MAEKMAEQIAEILKEPNFQTAEKALTDFCGPMDGEFRNLLVDIIVERWIDTPKDVPFSYARSIWNRKNINREEYQALLEEIRSYPIAPLIGKFCDLLEELYCRKNNWQKKKCITEPKLIAIRRRKIQAVRMEAEYAGASSKGNLMRKIHYLKEVIQLLKTIQGTEEERKALLQEIAQIEEASLSEMMVWSDKQDASGIVKELFRQLEDLDKEEALCYFASFLPIPERERVKNQVLNRTGILHTIFPVAILGKGGKLIAKSVPVKKPDGTIDEGALKDNKEGDSCEENSLIIMPDAIGCFCAFRLHKR